MQLDFSRLQLLGDPGTDQGRQWLLEVVDAFVVDARVKHARLARASAERDVDTVRRLAHEEKGVSAMLGAREVAGLFEAIESSPEDRTLVVCHLSAILPALEGVDREIRALAGPAELEGH